jgi:hypothetical protein
MFKVILAAMVTFGMSAFADHHNGAAAATTPAAGDHATTSAPTMGEGEQGAADAAKPASEKTKAKGKKAKGDKKDHAAH